MAMNGDFARLDREYGGEMEKQKEEEEADAEKNLDNAAAAEKLQTHMQTTTIDDVRLKSDRIAATGKGNLEGRLMVAETRVTGAVTWGGQSMFLFHVFKKF